MSDDSFEAPEEDVFVIRKITSTTWMKAKVLLDDDSIDLGEFSDDDVPPANGKAQGEREDLADAQLTTEDPALKSGQLLGFFVKPRKEEPVVIPVVNSKTVSPITYDLDRLLDPRIQKQAESGDRFSGSPDGPPPRQKRDPDARDFLTLNRKSAAKARSTQSVDAGDRRFIQHTDPVNVEARFYNYRRVVQEKVRKLEQELAQREMAQCTFEPDILEKRRPDEVPRTAEDFYQDQLLHQRLVKTKVQVLREKTEAAAKKEEGKLYTPKLCERSMKMLAGKPQDSLPRHEQLYRQHQHRMQQRARTSDTAASLDVSILSGSSESSAAPFTPAINKAAHMVVRDEPVEVYLMKDAARRQARSSVPAAEPQPAHLVTTASQALLLKRFREEFRAAWAEVSEQDDINYSQVAELLKALKFISNESAKGGFVAERELVRSIWTVMQLEDSASVAKRSLETFLCAVMNFPQTESEKPADAAVAEDASDKDDMSAEALVKPKTFGWVKDGEFVLAPGDTKRVHRHYMPWYDHRLALTSKSPLNPTFKSPVVYPYRPQISKNSQKITESHMADIASKGYQRHSDYLADEGNEREKKLRELVKRQDAETLKECVFKPETDKKSRKMLEARQERNTPDGLASDYFNLLKGPGGEPRARTDVLYDLANFAEKRKVNLQKSPDDREMEKSAVDCVFAPVTEVPLGTIMAELEVPPLPARGVDKTVERLLKARQDFEALQAQRERGLPNRASAPAGPRLDSSEPTTVFSVLVNGRAEEFRIRPGEQFSVVLNAFAAQHKINSEDLPSVETQLKDQYRAQFSQEPE